MRKAIIIILVAIGLINSDRFTRTIDRYEGDFAVVEVYDKKLDEVTMVDVPTIIAVEDKDSAREERINKLFEELMED